MWLQRSFPTSNAFRQLTVEGWIFFRSAGGHFWPLTAATANEFRGSFWGVKQPPPWRRRAAANDPACVKTHRPL